METNRKQKLMLFLSADLSGSTAYKYQHPVSDTAQEPWTTEFQNFFQQFHEAFHRGIKDLRGELGDKDHQHHSCISLPDLWKLNGDEILFKDILYTTKDGTGHDIGTLHCTIRAFFETVLHFDKQLLPKGLGVRGCAWTAGFPIRNQEIIFSETLGVSQIVTLKELPLDIDTGLTQLPPERTFVDYIGVDIDAGFRLAAATPPGRLAISLDIAWLLAQFTGANPLDVYHVGWRRLKGVIGDNPYPIIWVWDKSLPKRGRTPWEKEMDDRDSADLTRQFFARPVNPAPALIVKLVEEMRETLPQLLIKPYAGPRDMTQDHQRAHEQTTPPSNPSEL